ncbi:MAG TPA: hypothetical protein VJC18_04975, partial [bacterium]|nr:hypothetical protein [bacterium]
MSLRDRLVTAFAVLFATICMYMGTQKLVIHWIKVYKVDLLLPGEDKIPFLPLSIIIYALEYVLPIILFVLITRKKAIKKTVVAYGILIVVQAFFYVVMPVPYVLRPELNINMFGYELVWLLYQVDAPINTFPS